MKHYLHEVDEVFEAVNSSAEGLSSAEAEKRLQENGKNKLAEAKKVSMFSRFIDQLKDPMIIILLVAAVISAVKVSAFQFTSAPKSSLTALAGIKVLLSITVGATSITAP